VSSIADLLVLGSRRHFFWHNTGLQMSQTSLQDEAGEYWDGEHGLFVNAR
jgi:hypothetical protein